VSTPPTIDWAAALERVTADPGLARAVFQPIVDLKRGIVCGYELLARFAGPPRAPPDAWFGAAAALGRSAELEGLMLEKGLDMRGLLPPARWPACSTTPRATSCPWSTPSAGRSR